MKDLVNEYLRLIEKEFESANKKFPMFNSYHEGYAVLLEEVDELWNEIKHYKMNNNQARKERIESEAIQVAAMALKILIYNKINGIK